MIAKFDSVWGRGAILATIAMCLAAAWLQRNDSLGRRIHVSGPNAGPPAISLVGDQGERVVEAWDWRAGRHWIVPSPGRDDEQAITSDSTSIVYATDSELVQVAIQPPHQVARWRHGQTAKVVDIEHFDVDRRLAILRVYDAGSDEADLVSVDLATGRTIDRLRDVATVRRIPRETEYLVGFLSLDASDRVASAKVDVHYIRTRLDDTSRFITVDVGESALEFRPPDDSIEKTNAALAQRKLRIVYPVSSDGRYVAETTLDGDVNVIEIATGRVQWHFKWEAFPNKAFSIDGRELVISDSFGLAVYDMATGRRVAAEWEQPIGSWLLPLAILALVVCHAFATTLLFRDYSLRKAAFDAFLSQVSCFAVAYVVLQMSHWTRRDDIRVMNSEVVAGVATAAWTLGIGLYFGLGPKPLWRRTLVAFLVCASCWGLSFATRILRESYEGWPSETTPHVVSFLVASMIALWAIPVRWLGWSLRNDAEPGERLTFGVSDVLLATGLVAILVAGFQASERNALAVQDVLAMGAILLICVVPWVLAWAPFSRATLKWRAPALVVTGVLLVALVVRAFLMFEPTGENEFPRFGLGAFATGLLYLHALFLARAYGWRWTYVGPAMPPGTAAAGPPVDPLA